MSLLSFIQIIYSVTTCFRLIDNVILIFPTIAIYQRFTIVYSEGFLRTRLKDVFTVKDFLSFPIKIFKYFEKARRGLKHL